jgi:dTDP-4-amino-4,6-dideoxygalactose transaminase
VSEAIALRCLSVPVHDNLTVEERERVVEAIGSFAGLFAHRSV